MFSKKVEIIPLGMYKRISLSCPNCKEFSLKDIQKKIRINGKINYFVTCSKCGHDFKQVGRPDNYWRSLKQQYKLGSKQLRSMKSEMVKQVVETGDIGIKETENIIQIGDIVFIKPKKDNEVE